MKLYHVAGFVPGNSVDIQLNPGTQNACGIGVYFTEEVPQFKYAGGEKNGCVWNLPFFVLFEIDSAEVCNFYRSKNKPGRPRFRHSQGQTLVFKNEYIVETIEGNLCRVYRHV